MPNKTEIDWGKRVENLRVIMAKRGMNPSQVAKQADLGVNTVNRIIKGEVKPRPDTLELICNVLGVSNVAILDSDNPISEVRNELFRLVESATEEEARQLLEKAREIAGVQNE